MALVLFCFLGTGCKSKSASQDDSPEGKHIRKVADLFQEYAKIKKKSPSRLDEVKEWAIKEGKATEEDFASTRDSQTYGTVPSPMGGQLIIHEQTGKNGKCFMMFQGRVVELPKEDLDRQLEEFKGVRRGPARGMDKGGGSTK
jgi:hypothetical protein